mgnify:CR=1 FL=1
MAARPGQTHDKNVVILAEKDGLDKLDAPLAPSESAFLRQGAERDISSFFFPRADGGIFIRLLKPDKNPAFAAEDARLAGNELLSDLRKYKIETVTLRNFCTDNQSLAFAEGMVLGNYQFLKYFSDADKKENPLREIFIEGIAETDVAEMNALLDSVFLTRDLVNEPHSNLNALQLTTAIEAAGREYGFQVEVLGKEKLESIKMGGLLAVNRASTVPPQFCILEWKPANARNEKPIVLVGKGVVYDTGGLSLKPTEGMDYMKCDMAGAATVVGAMAVAARKKKSPPPPRAGPAHPNTNSARRCDTYVFRQNRRGAQHRCRGPHHLGRCVALCEKIRPGIGTRFCHPHRFGGAGARRTSDMLHGHSAAGSQN